MNSVKGTLKGLLFFFSWNDFCFFPKDFKSVIPFNIYSKCDKIILIGGGGGEVVREHKIPPSRRVFPKIPFYRKIFLPNTDTETLFHILF